MRAAAPASFPSSSAALIPNLPQNAVLLCICCVGRDRGGFLRGPSYQKDPSPISQGTNERKLLGRVITRMRSRQSFPWEPDTETRGGSSDSIPCPGIQLSWQKIPGLFGEILENDPYTYIHKNASRDPSSRGSHPSFCGRWVCECAWWAPAEASLHGGCCCRPSAYQRSVPLRSKNGETLLFICLTTRNTALY